MRLQQRWMIGGAIAAMILSGTASAQEPLGDWQGILQAESGPALRLVVHISKAAGDAYSGSLDDIDENASGIPLGAITVGAQSLSFDVPDLAAHYEATWDTAKARWKGRWSQGIIPYGLDLTRLAPGAPIETLRRPQMPAQPYPYREEEVAFDNPSEAVHLAGTLTLPSGPGPFPAVLLISGSGPLDRDETAYGHKPFLVLADYLARRGLAVLRIDQRGAGQSTGDREQATTADFSGDFEAGIAYLKQRAEVDAARIGLVGHSEGGLMGPMIAVRNGAVAFIVLWAAPGVKGELLSRAQYRLLAQDLGATDAEIAEREAVDRKVFEAADSAPDAATATERAREVLRAAYGPAAEGIEAGAKRAGSNWFRFFNRYDPAPTLRRVTCPVLAINGSKDRQVPSTENLAAIRGALADNRNAEVVELPGLNHFLQTAETGSYLEYGQIEETISPAALDLMADWIVRRSK